MTVYRELPLYNVHDKMSDWPRRVAGPEAAPFQTFGGSRGPKPSSNPRTAAPAVCGVGKLIEKSVTRPEPNA